MVREKVISPFPQNFSDRQWSRFVRLGRDLVQEESRIQFELGDISLKMIPTVEDHKDHGVFIVMDKYADQIGINVHTLINYRYVSHAWPAKHRAPGVSHSIHMALAALEDRFEIIQHPPEGMDRWTEDTALRRAGRLPQRALTKEEKLERIRTLARESEHATGAVEEIIRRPDVAHKIMSDPANARILYRAHHEQRQEAAAARFAAAHERSDEVEEPVEEPDEREDGRPLKPTTTHAPPTATLTAAALPPRHPPGSRPCLS
ncbi:DUF6192 family protein [Streptomyces sp. NPDC060030]|uniref:DUF6192 family protein n=1 Tax=Streptomyces sp. NPDC060030 TaxID=3347042 RepID=UPI0036A2031F